MDQGDQDLRPLQEMFPESARLPDRSPEAPSKPTWPPAVPKIQHSMPKSWTRTVHQPRHVLFRQARWVRGSDGRLSLEQVEPPSDFALRQLAMGPPPPEAEDEPAEPAANEPWNEWEFDPDELLEDFSYPKVVVAYHPRSRWAYAKFDPPPTQIVKLEDLPEEVSWQPPTEQDQDNASEIEGSQSDRSEEEYDSDDEYLDAKARVAGSAAIEMASFVLTPIESAEDEEAAQTRAALSEQWESGLAPDPLFCFHDISDSQRHWSQDDLPTGPLLCGTHKSAKYHARGGSSRYNVCPKCTTEAAKLRL